MLTRYALRALAAVTTPLLVVSLTAAPATAKTRTPKPTPPPPPTSQPVYVALGDSYAAGTGAGSYLSDGTKCYRSLKGYPGLIASSAGYALDLEACSGATMADVVQNQLGAVTAKKPGKVTITVGGNDVGFADTMTTCLGSDTNACLAKVSTASAKISTVEARLAATFAAVRQAAPGAAIVATAYPRLLSAATPDCSLFTTFTAQEVSAINAAADQLASVTRQAASEAGIDFADVEGSFNGHEVCTRSPWINNVKLLTQYESFHPNATGYASGYKPAVSTALGATATGASMTVTTGGSTSTDTRRGTVKAVG